MLLLMRQVSLACLPAITLLTLAQEVRAESAEARKRALAELLARRARIERVEERQARGAAVSRTVAPARVAASAQPYGIPPVSPVAPTGYGAGRDGYVESLYSQILGRSPTESEVAYWAQVLTTGVDPDIVATTIWRSTEHRRDVRNGTAPGVPLQTAIKRATAYGNSQRSGSSQ